MKELFSPAFQECISTLFKQHFAGYFKDAAGTSFEGKLRPWESALASQLGGFWTSWDAVQFCDEMDALLKKNQKVDIWQPVFAKDSYLANGFDFYCRLFKVFACANEPRNLAALTKGKMLADGASHMLRLLPASSPIWDEKKSDYKSSCLYEPDIELPNWLPVWTLYWFRGLCHKAMGQPEQALADYLRAESYLASRATVYARNRRQPPLAFNLEADILAVEAYAIDHIPGTVSRFFHDVAQLLWDMGDWGVEEKQCQAINLSERGREKKIRRKGYRRPSGGISAV